MRAIAQAEAASRFWDTDDLDESDEGVETKDIPRFDDVQLLLQEQSLDDGPEGGTRDGNQGGSVTATSSY